MTNLAMKELISAQRLATRIQALGKEISKDYNGQSLCVVGVLKGSFVFLADLVRSIELDCEIEFVGVSSYEGMESTGHVRLDHDLTRDIAGKDVLLVEDIIDTGLTIDCLLNIFNARQPKSLKVCCLLSKPEAHQVKLDISYIGFEISKEFVVGFGLDFEGRYRNLPNLMQVTNA